MVQTKLSSSHFPARADSYFTQTEATAHSFPDMFPAPVGGLVLPSDFAPSIIFAALYGLLLPLVVYRLTNRDSRTVLLIGRTIFTVERIVVFSIRAAQSQKPSMALSTPLLKYTQVSFGLSFVGIANDLVNLVRCLLVNPTYGSATWDLSPAARTKDSSFPRPQQGEEDHPDERARARRLTSIANLGFLAAIIPGAIGNGDFNEKDFADPATAAKVFDFRYASNAVTVILIVIIAVAATWSRVNQVRASRKAINIIYLICALAMTVAAYRFAVIWHKTPSLDSTAPGTLNSPGAKACFYILQVLPEWLASVVIFGLNIRQIFGTGPVGDFGGWREQKKIETAMKNAEVNVHTVGV